MSKVLNPQMRVLHAFSYLSLAQHSSGYLKHKSHYGKTCFDIRCNENVFNGIYPNLTPSWMNDFFFPPQNKPYVKSSFIKSSSVRLAADDFLLRVALKNNCLHAAQYKVNKISPMGALLQAPVSLFYSCKEGSLTACHFA